MIHTVLFVERVKNLAQCIDLLDLITVYQKGKSIGCRIGLVDENTLGKALGFQAGDIITGVDGIAPTDTEQRMNIYKKIIHMKPKESFVVSLKRQQQDVTVTYMLSDTKKTTPKADATAPDASKVTSTANEELTQEQLKVLEERHTFAPTLKDLRDRERQNMLERGKAPENSSTSSFTE
jgi:hypothetical protein